jgi:hypothetical protein
LSPCRVNTTPAIASRTPSTRAIQRLTDTSRNVQAAPGIRGPNGIPGRSWCQCRPRNPKSMNGNGGRAVQSRRAAVKPSHAGNPCWHRGQSVRASEPPGRSRAALARDDDRPTEPARTAPIVGGSAR